MRKRKMHRIIRKSHRYLGLVFGIQFLFWTIGGLYFSWTDIKQIRGEDIRKNNPPLLLESSSASLSQIISRLKANKPVDHIETVQLAEVLGKTYYQVSYHDASGMKIQLADAETGELRPPLTEQEAIAVANSRLLQSADVVRTEYLKHTSGQHEYREKPLPAYAITYGGKVNTTVYVSAEAGTVQSFRNNRWRIFDFLWMLHTMDYENRDNINNWLLRIFSAFGLVLIISGLALYTISYKKSKIKPQAFNTF